MQVESSHVRLTTELDAKIGCSFFTLKTPDEKSNNPSMSSELPSSQAGTDSNSERRRLVIHYREDDEENHISL